MNECGFISSFLQVLQRPRLHLEARQYSHYFYICLEEMGMGSCSWAGLTPIPYVTRVPNLHILLFLMVEIIIDFLDI